MWKMGMNFVGTLRKAAVHRGKIVTNSIDGHNFFCAESYKGLKSCVKWRQNKEWLCR